MEIRPNILDELHVVVDKMGLDHLGCDQSHRTGIRQTGFRQSGYSPSRRATLPNKSAERLFLNRSGTLYFGAKRVDTKREKIHL